MWLCGMVDLRSRVKCSGTNTDLGIWLKSNLGSRVGFGSKVKSKSQNWNWHSLPMNGMWLSTLTDQFQDLWVHELMLAPKLGQN